MHASITTFCPLRRVFTWGCASGLALFAGDLSCHAVASLLKFHRGVLFELAFAPTSRTQPSHAFILTGLDMP